MNSNNIKNLRNKVRMLRATLLIRNKKFQGKIYHVIYNKDLKRWSIKTESGKTIRNIRDKENAMRMAKHMAKKLLIGQVFEYRKNGIIQKAYTYVNESRKIRRIRYDRFYPWLRF